MQHVNNLLDLQKFQQQSASNKQLQNAMATQQKTSSNSTNNTIAPHNAIRVWRVFSHIYGSTFVTQFGELPNQIWIEELAKFSPHDIEFGIEQCKRSGSDFAPSLPKFLAYCTPPIVEDVYRQERETRIMLDAPKRTSTADVRKSAILEMKQSCRTYPPPQE